MRNEELKIYVKEAERKKSAPYRIDNKDIANEIYKIVKADYPNADIIEVMGTSYICLTEKAKEKVKVIILKMIEERTKQIKELETIIEYM